MTWELSCGKGNYCVFKGLERKQMLLPLYTGSPLSECSLCMTAVPVCAGGGGSFFSLHKRKK